jgi:TIR domain
LTEGEAAAIVPRSCDGRQPQQSEKKSAGMADIFISHSHKDRNVAQMLASQLEAQGLSTWWDALRFSRRQPDNTKAQELESALIVLVLWTKSSVASPFVLHEAILAREARKILQAKTSDIQVGDIPRAFRSLRTFDVGDPMAIAAMARAAFRREDAVADGPTDLGSEVSNSKAATRRKPERNHATPDGMKFTRSASAAREAATNPANRMIPSPHPWKARVAVRIALLALAGALMGLALWTAYTQN